MRPIPNLTIPITLVRSSGEALHEQIAGQVSAAIRDGLLPPRAQLPSTRSLAGLLGVSRGVTIAAYELLFARGCVRNRPGSGTFVAALVQAEGQSATTGRRPVVDLRAGQPSTEAFPLEAWRTAWRRASFRQPPAQAPPALGVPSLRHAISDFLGTKGRSLKDKHLVVTSGAEQSLSLVLEALGLHGPSVAVEEPSPAALWRVAGSPPVPLPVDGCGARVGEIPPRCRAAVLAADAQIPYGTILSPQRRAEAARWARDTGGHLIEVACDTVLRPELSGVPHLSALAGDYSVLIGGFDELFTPGIRLGYAVVPGELAAELGRIIARRADQPSYVTQLAMESMLRDGTVRRLTHQLGRLYARKRRLMGQLSGTLNCAVLRLASDLDAEQVAAELLRRGLLIDTLAPYHFSGLKPPPALVVGFGHLPDPVLGQALGTIAGMVGPSRASRIAGIGPESVRICDEVTVVRWRPAH